MLSPVFLTEDIMKKSIKPDTHACPTPAWCVCTYDADGKANVMTVAWAGICCSDPPCLSVTVSIPSVKYLKQADYFGMVSGKDVDKFATSGLTATRSDVVDAPYVDEFPLIFECTVKEAVEVGGHVLFVGEIAGVKADDEVSNDEGLPLPEKVNPFIYAPTTGDYIALADVVGRGGDSGREISGRKNL